MSTVADVWKATQSGGPAVILLLLVGIVVLWRELKLAQASINRQQDLFDEALRVIRDARDLEMDKLINRRRGRWGQNV